MKMVWSQDWKNKFQNKESKPISNFQAKSGKEESDFWTRLLKHRMEIFIRAAIVLVILAIATVGFFFYFKNKQYTSYDVIGRANTETVSGATSLRYGNYFLTYSCDGMNCRDASGTVLWNETYEMQNPMIDICGDVAAIADYNGSKIYVVNTKGILGTIDTGMPIRVFKVSANGMVVAILEDVKTTPIYVFNAQGEKKAFFSTSMKNSGYPLGISISDSGYLVGISYLYVDSGTISTTVAYYNFGEVGQNETDNLVSGYTYTDAIVPEIRFLGDDKAVAIADNRLMFYSGSQKPTSINDVLLQEEILSIYSNDEYVALVFANTSGEDKYRVDIYDGSGRKKDSISLNMEYRDIFFNGARIVIYNENECLIHNVGGSDKFAGTFEDAVMTMMPSNTSSRYVLVTAEEFQTIELK